MKAAPFISQFSDLFHEKIRTGMSQAIFVEQLNQPYVSTLGSFVNIVFVKLKAANTYFINLVEEIKAEMKGASFNFYPFRSSYVTIISVNTLETSVDSFFPSKSAECVSSDCVPKVFRRIESPILYVNGSDGSFRAPSLGAKLFFKSNTFQPMKDDILKSDASDMKVVSPTQNSTEVL